MRKRWMDESGLRRSRFEGLRWRFNEAPPVSGAGPAPTDSVADVLPVNGGPERDFDAPASGGFDIAKTAPTGSSATGTSATGSAPAGQTAAPTPADPNQRAGATQAAQTAAEWQSIREAAEAQGFRFGQEVKDDRAALNYLLAQAQRAQSENVYAQLGRQLAPKAGEIQQYLNQPKTPSAPARQPWEAPEFDERWVNLVEQDPASGLYVSRQGVPHEIADKVNAYAEWKRSFDRNPSAMINGMVEARAKAVAEQTFQQQFAAHQQQATIASIVQENSAWLYQSDQAGQPLRDYSGNYVPTPVGAAYLQQLQAVRQMGVTDPRAQDNLAKQIVRGQFALAAQQKAWAEQQAAAGGVMTAAAVGSPNVNPLQAAPPSTRRANPAATEPDEAGLSLAERLRRDLAADGVTDADVFNSFE